MLQCPIGTRTILITLPTSWNSTTGTAARSNPFDVFAGTSTKKYTSSRQAAPDNRRECQREGSGSRVRGCTAGNVDRVSRPLGDLLRAPGLTAQHSATLATEGGLRKFLKFSPRNGFREAPPPPRPMQQADWAGSQLWRGHGNFPEDTSGQSALFVLSRAAQAVFVFLGRN